MNLPQLIQQVIHIELIFFQFLCQFSGIFFIDGAFCLFNQRQHIAHPQNTGCHSFRMERFKIIQLFAHADVFNRLTGYCQNGQGCTATGVRVQLRHQNAVDSQRIIKCLCNIDSILTGHRIDNQDGLMNFHSFLDLLKLCHHIFIYMKTSCSIKDHNIVTILCCMLNCCLRNIRRLILVSHGEHLYALLLCVDLQLLNCSRTVYITCYQKWFLTF